MADHHIESFNDLQSLCGEWHAREWLSVDTEFMREKTYYAQLCLIQVSDGRDNACIDPLCIDDLSPLADIMANPKILKVFHSARQDLEVLFQALGQMPGPIFDTQLAAALAGFGDQTGYAMLVNKLLRVTLDKAHTRTDWSARPLRDEQVQYALDDVRYLGSVFEKLRTRLADAGRLDWLTEDFNALVDTRTYTHPPDDSWRKLRGARKLKGVQLAVLRDLTLWREEQARTANRPRKWILRDEPLLELARQMPADRAAMERVRGMERGLVEKRGETLLAIIRDTRATPAAQWPELENHGPPLTPQQDALVDALMAVLRLCANEQKVSTTSLATRRELERLAQGDQSVPVLHGWRRGLAGETLFSFLRGDVVLNGSSGYLEISNK